MHPGARTCPACGRHFTCDLAAGREACWCMALPPVTPEGKACVCRACLRARG